eukprot:EG_transcript_33996
MRQSPGTPWEVSFKPHMAPKSDDKPVPAAPPAESPSDVAFRAELQLTTSLQAAELCFPLCVPNFYTQRLLPWESRCLERCGAKYRALQAVREAAMQAAEPLVQDLERQLRGK